MSKYHCHVICNTHWDREWRYPFQAYRMDLVDLMDRLLDVLEQNDEYRAFLLDSQTVILEDYLEIRPENERRIKRLAQADRLQIGPWYTLPDEWGCPGEALVRNLLVGHQVGQKYGPIFKVGYTPFSNGQVSQLPQIYLGFGIDSAFFYRGVGKHVAKCEFLWEGADDSQIYGFKFGDYARYNYYYLAYRPGMLGRTIKDRDYQWNPGEVPYRVATDQAQDHQYGWLNQELKLHPENLPRALDDTRTKTAEDATTTQLLYMMGHDHSFATEKEVELVRALREAAGPDGDQIFISSLNDYLKAFKKEAKDLQVLKGEMRHTNKCGLWTTLMARILSCRLYLKQRNADINAQIIHGSEPLAAMAFLRGVPYPKPFFEIAWKDILVNQAHDAIGGCSVDRVHEEMLTRWNSVETISDEIERRSMREVVRRIDGSSIDPEHYQLTVFNPMPRPRPGIAEFIVDLPHAGGDTEFAICTTDGKKIPCQILSREEYIPTIEDPYELSMTFEVQRCRVLADLPALPGMGYEALVVKPGEKGKATGGSILNSPTELENEHLKVRIESNGTATVTDKRSGIVREGVCYLEDTAEFGDPWNRKVPESDQPIYTLDVRAELDVLAEGPLAATIRARYTLTVPKGKDGERRSAELIDLPIEVLYTLRRDEPFLDVRLNMENKAENHRLRLMVPANLPKAMHSFADGQYDVVKRPITKVDPEGWKEPPYTEHPMWNFVDVGDGEEGLAVINNGLIEYEAIDNDERTLAITLLRAFGTFVFNRPTPGSQCLRPLSFHFWVYPHAGSWEESRLTELKQRFLTPVPAIQSAPTRGTMPLQDSFLDIEGAVDFGAVKPAEANPETLVVRVCNTRESAVPIRIKPGFTVKTASEMSMEEIPGVALEASDGVYSLDVPAKKIFTVGFTRKKTS